VEAAFAVLLSSPLNQIRPFYSIRVTAVSTPQAGALLHVVPIAAIGTRWTTRSLRIVVAVCLGAPVCTEHRFVCGEMIEVIIGTHEFSCRKPAGRLARHNAVSDLIKRALLSAEILSPRIWSLLNSYVGLPITSDPTKPCTMMRWTCGQGTRDFIRAGLRHVQHVRPHRGATLKGSPTHENVDNIKI
jgi:hypothetical protein